MIQMNELISVILATYNTERFVCQAVQSVLDQTYGNFEVIIVDDGSTDGTRALLEPYLRDPRVSYVYQPNAGQPAADNHGLALARGSLIAFIDADDAWVPDKLERQLPLFANPAVGVVYGPIIRIDENGRVVPAADATRHAGRITERLFVENFIPFTTTVVRRACFEKAGQFDVHLRTSYDYDLWLRISTDWEFAFVEQPAAYYRTWSGQMSHRRFRVFYECGMLIMRRFQAAHPQAISASASREAWAHTYTGRAYFVRKYERSMLGALGDYLRALSVHPFYFDAYKGIAETLLRPQWR